MSTNTFDNIRLPDIGSGTLGKLKFYTDDNLNIFANAANQLTINATNAAGKLSFTAGTGGILIDSTFGASTTGTVAGPVNIVSQAASSWINDSSDLTLQTTTSGAVNLTSIGGIVASAVTASSFKTTTGDLTVGTTDTGNLILNTVGTGTVALTSATSLSIDSVTSISLGTSTATSIVIGNINAPVSLDSNVTITGNLTVNGTTTTVNNSVVNVGENFIVLNTDAGNDSVDAGMLIQRAGSDIVAGTAAQTALITQATTTGSAVANQITISATDTSSAVGTWIKLTGGVPTTMTNQYAQIKSISSGIATISTQAVVLTGTEFVSSGPAGSRLILGTGSSFTTQVSYGDTVSLSDSANNSQNYVVTTVISDVSMIVTDSNLNNITATYAEVFINGWDQVALTGSTFTVSGSGTTLTGVASLFTTELSAGASIRLTITGVSQVYVVLSADSPTVATLNGVNTTDGASATAFYMSPGSGVEYSTYTNAYVGSVFDKSTDKFKFTTSTSNRTITGGTLLNMQAKDVDFTSATLTSTTLASNTGSWLSGVYSTGSILGTLLDNGGIAGKRNLIVEGSGLDVNGPIASFTQSSATGAQIPLQLIQADVSEPFINYSGSSVASGNYTTITDSIVVGAGNINIGSAAQTGYAKIYITDNSTATGGTIPKITSGFYYIPFYTLTAP